MTDLDHNSQAVIAERCRTLVPGVEVIEGDDDDPPRVCVSARGVLIEFRWWTMQQEWRATISEDECVCEELPDVVRVLWDTFGALLYPTVLWEVLDADASSSSATVWNMALDVLAHPKDNFHISEHAIAGRQAARMCLAMALESHDLDFPMDLVIEAIAMATPTHRMHKDWCRPTIGPDDRGRICP